MPFAAAFAARRAQYTRCDPIRARYTRDDPIRAGNTLFEMRIPVPASVIAQEERQEAAQRKQAQAKDLPPSSIVRVWTKTVHGRAQVTQINPDTYQIKMLHHAH